MTSTSAAATGILPRTRRTTYWAATAFLAAEMAVGGAWDILRIPYVRGVLAHLGYPPYLLTILGVWAIPGAIVLLAPRWPRLKEWAYAGAVFTYTGAVASHLAVGDGPGSWAYPLFCAGLAGVSWALRPPARRDPVPR